MAQWVQCKNTVNGERLLINFDRVTAVDPLKNDQALLYFQLTKDIDFLTVDNSYKAIVEALGG